jgi:hypothetical protein
LVQEPSFIVGTNQEPERNEQYPLRNLFSFVLKSKQWRLYGEEVMSRKAKAQNKKEIPSAIKSIIAFKLAPFWGQTKFRVDKCDHSLDEEIHIDVLFEHAKRNGLVIQRIRRNDEGQGYRIGHIQFLTRFKSEHLIYKVTSNPSKFLNFNNWYNEILKITPDSIQKTWNICRLDLAWDSFHEDYQTFSRKIIVIDKHYTKSFVDKNGMEESKRYGKNNKSVITYDKLKQSRKSGNAAFTKEEIKEYGIDPDTVEVYGIGDDNVDQSGHYLDDNELSSHFENGSTILQNKSHKGEYHNRLEISFMGRSNVPTKDIHRLKDAIQSHSFNPFKTSFYYDYKFLYEDIGVPKTVSEKNLLVKFIKINTMIEHLGLALTKKRLTTSNFIRDYQDVLDLSCKYCIGDFYHDGIKKYLNAGL